MHTINNFDYEECEPPDGTEKKTQGEIVGSWNGFFAKKSSDLEIKINAADAVSISGEVIIKRAFAGKSSFSAKISEGAIEDFACKAYLASRCTVSNLKLSQNKLTGTLVFNNGEDIRHDFSLIKIP